MSRRLVLVHAHPDDETITTGGTMARYAAEGAEVLLVTCTLGEEGEIIPPELAGLGSWAGDQLGGYRSGELSAALRELGVTEHRFLGGIGGWRDSGMAGTAAADHPRAFAAGPLDEQVLQLKTIVDEMRPDVLVTYNSFGGYGHPDHIRAHEITMAVADSATRVFHIAAGGGAVLPPEAPAAAITTTIDIRPYLGAKIAALRAHATQVTVDPPEFALSNGVAQPIGEAEYFTLVRGPREGAGTDLFGGLG
ncbi:N-acetyl-1-D-myo-inositol-2-amino-2-deoxy-alpha-D-glucopyranoside deacetylase [Amycolatopsis alkalitolerans]|uniref:N-acetyl-1-D-myo-inositol-2-amino-2-deoxy-alpha- D-glucopyranoside deacetylase n=1 Tax=Amycolatopsis alkalitolerans TaxID=2547244 RepID=UPI0022862D30|nr:N-acetyl-1-D-myo-inositol-2-amino-2-deoxy-alpha-D-glucopyranoside deacetylase [Amycolatopsis alkalitolerans]